MAPPDPIVPTKPDRYGLGVDETLLSELKRYVGWGPGDEESLRKIHPLLKPHFAEMVAVFYDRILEHPRAREALVGGESRVGHLKVTLIAWLEVLLLGPWDEAYYEQRARIGRKHVRIALPQHYMFAALNVLRRGLDEALAAEAAVARDGKPSLSAEEQVQARTALGRILDLELAIMLHTYREDLLAQQARGERLATFGQMAASIGHELRNPLGVIESSVFLLRSRVQNDERASKQVERIGEQVNIASGIITGLLELIRDKPLTRSAIQPRAAAQGRRSSSCRCRPTSPSRPSSPGAARPRGRSDPAAAGVRQPDRERGPGGGAHRREGLDLRAARGGTARRLRRGRRTRRGPGDPAAPVRAARSPTSRTAPGSGSRSRSGSSSGTAAP